MADSSDSVAPLLASLELHQLRDALARETVGAWTALPRAELLAHLRSAGVKALKDRQAIANGLGRWQRQSVMQSSLEELQSSSAAPVVISSTYGLGNQLRVLLSYRAAAAAQGRPLVLVWEKMTACNALYRELFEPIEGCVVVEHFDDLELVRPGLSRLPRGVFPTVYYTHPAVHNTPLETSMWEVLRPVASIRAAVEANLATLGDSFVAVHVRRTDHMTSEGGKIAKMKAAGEWVTEDDFRHFLDRHGGRPIYLATDNAATQQEFLARYGERIRCCVPIEPPPADASEVYRHTHLSQAVVDIFTCAASHAFMGTYYSSFSDAIQRLRLARGRHSTEDRHRVTPPPWDPVLLGQTCDMSIALDDPALLALLAAFEKHGHVLATAHAEWVAEGWGGGSMAPGEWIPTGALQRCGAAGETQGISAG